MDNKNTLFCIEKLSGVNYYECKLADLSPVRRNHFTL